MRFLAVLLLAAVAFAKQASVPIPEKLLTAKTVAVFVLWPNGSDADRNGVRHDVENWLRKWKRYKVVESYEHPDIALSIEVEPITVHPGFWAKRASVYANSTDSTIAPAPGPYVVLGGKILLWDASVVKDGKFDSLIWMIPASEKGKDRLFDALNGWKKALDTKH